MKNKIWLYILLLCFVDNSVYGQQTAKDIQEKAFGKIRAEMVKETCNKFGYSNRNVIQLINPKNLNNFHKTLAKDTVDNRKVKWLWNAVGNVPSIRGNNVKKDKEALENYLKQIQTACLEHVTEGIDTIDGLKYRKELNKLATECDIYQGCKSDNDFRKYLNDYPKGLFIELVEEANNNQEQTQTTESEDDTAESDTQASSHAMTEEETNKHGPTGSDQSCSKCGKSLSECTCKDNNSMIVTILLGALVLLFGGGCVYCRKKSQTHNKTGEDTRSKSPSKQEQSIVTNQETSSKEQNSNPQEDVFSQKHVPENLDPTISQEGVSSNNKWIVVGASVKGNGHIQSNMPCQDNHKFESYGNGWGVAVVSDGAGSAAHSELGSKVVAERGMTHFKNLIEKEEWMKNNELPTDVEWLQKSYYVLKAIRDDVVMFSKKKNVEVKSMSATCLAVIYSPLGLLAVHVGDGRMGYKSVGGEWKAMMTPHKGEEANQTIFLVSDFWSIPNFVLSGVLVPESIVVREPVKAFTLMSDGCENAAWQCVTLNKETGKYYDQNKPFERFFNPLEETLLSFQANNVPDEEQQTKWNKFIESGTDGFVREQDDKTMIYGYCCTQQEIDDYIEKSKDPAPLY